MLVSFCMKISGLFGKSKIVFYNSALLCTVPECARAKECIFKKSKEVLLLEFEFLYSVDH